MTTQFSDRIVDVPPSFIREILKVSLDPEMISFAGGLPNKNLFPVQAIQRATEEVFQIYGKDCFQYSNTEGFDKLRQLIANRYREKKGIDVDPGSILIINGSQQGFDLLGKVLLNTGDGVIVEEPGYLGAIQAFSLFRPVFRPFAVGEDGINVSELQEAVKKTNVKLMYTVPNFQNPSGITYSDNDRKQVCHLLEGTGIILVEDDPYGELRFSGSAKPSFYSYLPRQTVLLGSFSKTIIPGFRIGWVIAPEDIRRKLLIAKQASDLHTCNFTQYIFHQYLCKNDVDEHIQKIRDAYGCQCTAMIEGMEKYFPETVSFTRPEGGMFLWGKLKNGRSAMDLFNLAVQEKVVFVPGDPFFIAKKNTPAFRLSFSCVDKDTIDTGLQRLVRAVEKLS